PKPSAISTRLLAGRIQPLQDAFLAFCFLRVRAPAFARDFNVAAGEEAGRERRSMLSPFYACGACFPVMPASSHNARTFLRSSPGASIGVSRINARPGSPAGPFAESLG